MGGLLHLVQRGGDWAKPQPAQAPPRCTKCNSPPINLIGNPIMASVPVTVFLYNSLLLRDCNVAIKRLMYGIQLHLTLASFVCIREFAVYCKPKRNLVIVDVVTDRPQTVRRFYDRFRSGDEPGAARFIVSLS